MKKLIFTILWAVGSLFVGYGLVDVFVNAQDAPLGAGNSTVGGIPPFRTTSDVIVPRDKDDPLGMGGSASQAGEIRLLELSGNGTDYVAVSAPDSIGSTYTWTWPSTDGSNGDAMVTDGSGILSFTTISGGGGGGGPSAAEYLVLTATSTLSEERIFTDGICLTGTDAGANGAYTLDLDCLDQTGAIYVGKHGDDSNNGQSPQLAKLTVSAGIAAASAGDTVWVYPGTYAESELALTAGVNLIGADRDSTIISNAMTATTATEPKGIIEPGGTNYIANITLTDTSNPASVTYTSAIALDDDADSTTVEVFNARLEGAWDAVYVSPDTTGITAIFRDVDFYADYDGIGAYGRGGMKIKVYNSRFDINGVITTSNSHERGIAIYTHGNIGTLADLYIQDSFIDVSTNNDDGDVGGIWLGQQTSNTDGATATIVNTYITVVGNGTADAHGVFTQSTATSSVVNMYGSYIDTSGATNNYDANENAGAITIANTEYDSVNGTIDTDGTFVENSNTVPGSCIAGQLYIDNDATSGQRFYACESGSFVLQDYGAAANSIDGTDIALGGDAQGDVMFYGGTDWEALPAGYDGQQLETNGTGANPSWEWPSRKLVSCSVNASTIVKGTPVFFSAWNASGLSEVDIADADTAAEMPAVGIAGEDLDTTCNAGDSDYVAMSGVVSGLDTSTPGWSEGDVLYVSTHGACTTNYYDCLTNTAPTGEANNIQKIGQVARVNAGNGSIVVSGAGRSNATPNLDSAAIFVGNASNQSVAVDMSGDVLIDNTGATTIQADSVALATDTTGNYVATIADAGSGNVTVVGSGSENAAVTLDVADNYCKNTGDQIDGTLTIDDTNTAALLVRKDGNGGDVLIVDTNTSRVGIGGNPLANLFEIIGDGAHAIGSAYAYGAGFVPSYSGYSARGSRGTPTASMTDDYLLFQGGRGYGTTSFGSGSKGVFGVKASQTWTDANQGTYLSFEVTPDGSTSRAEQMRLTQDAQLGVGMTSPNERLTVEGALSLDEIAAPSNTAGYGKLYVKSSDSNLYFQDDGGTETDLTAGGSGANEFTYVLSPLGSSLPTSNFPALNKTVGTNLVYHTLDFDNATDESAYWQIPLPPSVTPNTCKIEIAWTTTAGGAAETVQWDINWRSIANDEVLDATATPSETNDTVSDTWIADGDVHLISKTLTTCTNMSASDLLMVEIVRDISEDDLGGDAKFIRAVFEITD